MAAVLRRLILGRTAAQTFTLQSLSTRSVHSDMCREEGFKQMIDVRVSSWLKKSDDCKIKTLESDLKYVQEAIQMIENLNNFQEFTNSQDMIMFNLDSIISSYANVLEKYPQADSIEIFRIRFQRRRQMPNYAGANNDAITKDQVKSRVLDVIKLYPKFDQTRLHVPSFLMYQGHLYKDLGLDLKAWEEIVRGLEIEFMPETYYKLERIPQEIQSCNILVDYIYENIRSLSSKGDPTDEQIYSLASVVIGIVEDLTNNMTSWDYEAGVHKPFDAVCLIRGLAAFWTFPILSKLRLISTVFNGIQNHPQVKKWKVYHIRLYIRSMNKDDCNDSLTKNDIIPRVLNVIKHNPIIVDRSKVKEDSYFHRDLNLNEEDQIAVVYGLALEFKLDIPSNLESCKHAIDYIYNNSRKRLSLEKFDEKIGFGLVFGSVDKGGLVK